MSKKHIFFYNLFYYPIVLYLKMKFGYTFEVAKDLPDTYLVLSNHTTDYDPLLVAASFRRQMYFVGSEHISRWNWISKFLQYCFAPIMRPKGTLASSTVIEMLRKVRGGANVCLFAEGVRSWDGISSPLLPSTGKMVKSARCGLVTYKITGGYFVSPMWSASSKTRRGYLHGAPVHIYTPQQLAAMTAEEVNDIIAHDLYEDAYARQLSEPKVYKGKGLAEQMEKLLFRCPQCNATDTFLSHDDTVTCSACGLSFQYNEYGMLENAPYPTVREFAAWQKEQVSQDAGNGVVYTSPSGTLTKIVGQQEIPVAQGPVSLSPYALTCGDTEFPLDQISDLAMHGRQFIVFSVGKAYYELVPSPDTNALKFLLLYKEYQKQAAPSKDI